MSLRDLVINSAQRTPDALAVQGFAESLTYAALDGLSNRFARALMELGVRQQDRVGIWLEKSPGAMAAMQGVLRLGAVYVPLDPLSPTARVRTILHDCDIQVLITNQKRGKALQEGNDRPKRLVCLYLDNHERATGLDWHQLQLMAFSDEPIQSPPSFDDEMAYILYTSGSTGRPKGVCISNRNALAFIEWAKTLLQATSADRFANHAPLHFDLSVLDLYVAFSVGAAVFLIPDGISYMARRLTDCIVQEGLTIWYSVPSVLVLMMDQGGLLEMAAPPLRAVLFAGEVFPLKNLRLLREPWPTVRFLNLYGPTETNVCTYYEVTAISGDRTRPVPIGRACCGDQVWAQKEDGTDAQIGEEGELMVVGPTVMLGYWGQPGQAGKPYATGDMVKLQADGNYMYVGRRDHMVKVRGYRIETGDIEAALEEHPAIHAAAVLVIGSGTEARLWAFVVLKSNETAPTLLEIKRHCAERLPRYMIVHDMCVLPALPRTRNGKIDRQVLSSHGTHGTEGRK